MVVVVVVVVEDGGGGAVAGGFEVLSVPFSASFATVVPRLRVKNHANPAITQIMTNPIKTTMQIRMVWVT